MSVRHPGLQRAVEPPVADSRGDAHLHRVDWFALSESNIPHTRNSGRLADQPPPTAEDIDATLLRALQDAVARGACALRNLPAGRRRASR